MMKTNFLLRFWSLLGALVALSLLPLSAQAAGGHALVIGESSYAGVAELPDCRHAVDLVSARLRELGFAVDEAVDASAGDTRVAIARFAAAVASMPSQPSLAYVCAVSIIEGQRLFLLPSDVDLQMPIDPETEGIVVPALLNAMRGSDGTLVGDFVVQGDLDQRAALDALSARLPSGLHLALAMIDKPPVGRLGIVLSDSATPLTAGWAALASASRAHLGKEAVALYPPPPVSAPVEKLSMITELTSNPVSDAAPPAAPAPNPGSLAPLQVIAIPPTPPETAFEDQAKAASSSDVKAHRVHPYARRSSLRIQRLQNALRYQGLYRGPVNGAMDERTIMAVRAYQISIGKPSSGTLTGSEVNHLLSSR